MGDAAQHANEHGNDAIRVFKNHQPSFSRVSERSQEEDEESLERRPVRKGKKAGQRKSRSTLRASSVSRSNVSDNSRVGSKSQTAIFFNSQTQRRAGRRKPMESQVKVKQSVKRSASITKQLAAEIHERATQA